MFDLAVMQDDLKHFWPKRHITNPFFFPEHVIAPKVEATTHPGLENLCLSTWCSAKGFDL